MLIAMRMPACNKQGARCHEYRRGWCQHGSQFLESDLLCVSFDSVSSVSLNAWGDRMRILSSIPFTPQRAKKHSQATMTFSNGKMTAFDTSAVHSFRSLEVLVKCLSTLIAPIDNRSNL
jgi:hypothetical protein